MSLLANMVFWRVRRRLMRAARQEAKELNLTIEGVKEEFLAGHQLPHERSRSWMTHAYDGRYPEALLLPVIEFIRMYARLGGGPDKLPKSDRYAPTLAASAIALLDRGMQGCVLVALVELTGLSFADEANKIAIDKLSQGERMLLSFSAADLLARILHLMRSRRLAIGFKRLIQNQEVLMKLDEAEDFIVEGMPFGITWI